MQQQQFKTLAFKEAILFFILIRLINLYGHVIYYLQIFFSYRIYTNMASEKNMIVRSPASHIPRGDLSEIRRQIKGELIACAFDLDKCPDMASEEEQAIIFEQMKSCMETFRHLNNRLHGTAEDLPTPVGLPQNTSSDIQQQFEEYIGDDSAIVTVLWM